MRVLLKISGESLKGQKEGGIDYAAAIELAKRIVSLYKEGIEIAIVLGGGNILRGSSKDKDFPQTPADQIGMLATLMNGIALEQAIRAEGVNVRLVSALDCPKVAETYQWDKVMRHLAKKKIVIFVGGTGHPYFTTDTCAALRCLEINADLFLKCTTQVDGIYSEDPLKNPHAVKYNTITYNQILNDQLGILDLTAVTMCMKGKIPIRVYNLYSGSFKEAIDGKFGSIVVEAL